MVVLKLQISNFLGPKDPISNKTSKSSNTLIQTDAELPGPTMCHRDSHSHPVEKLLHRLAVDGDGHPGISIEGELQAVEDLGLLAVLGGAVGTIFIPSRQQRDRQ